MAFELFERLAIDVLRQCDVNGGMRILRISWDEAWGVMQRAVTRGRTRKQVRIVRHIGVDENEAAKGHRYWTLVCDLDEGTVEHIAEGRTQASLDGYYAGLTPVQLDGIEAVAMDMWEPYIQATRAQVPEADTKMVFDRFHVMDRIGKAVDTVRKQEHRDLMAAGDETLKGSKYLWLYSPENVPARRREECALPCGVRHSRSAGRGPSKTHCAACGATCTRCQGGSFGSGGTSGPCTADWSRFASLPKRFVGTSTTL